MKHVLHNQNTPDPEDPAAGALDVEVWRDYVQETITIPAGESVSVPVEDEVLLEIRRPALIEQELVR